MNNEVLVLGLVLLGSKSWLSSNSEVRVAHPG